MHIPESIHDYLVTFGVERETRPGRDSARIWSISRHTETTRASANLVSG